MLKYTDFCHLLGTFIANIKISYWIQAVYDMGVLNHFSHWDLFGFGSEDNLKVTLEKKQW